MKFFLQYKKVYTISYEKLYDLYSPYICIAIDAVDTAI